MQGYTIRGPRTEQVIDNDSRDVHKGLAELTPEMDGGGTDPGCSRGVRKTTQHQGKVGRKKVVNW